jgi:hypothetical protein
VYRRASGKRNGQYRHGERTKAAIAEQRKFSALLKMLRAVREVRGLGSPPQYPSSARQCAILGWLEAHEGQAAYASIQNDSGLSQGLACPSATGSACGKPDRRRPQASGEEA